MDFTRILASLRQFWPAVAVVLTLTAVGVILVPFNISPEYKASGTVLLLSPSTEGNAETGKSVPVNPWSRFGASGEGVAGTALIELLTSLPVEREIMVDDAVNEYQITPNPGGNGAILDISVLASDADAALDTFQRLVDRLVLELDSRQEAVGAPVEKRLRAEMLTAPTKAVEMRGSQMRAAVAVAVLGTLAAVAVVAALDTIKSRRRSVDSTPEGETVHQDATDVWAEPGQGAEPAETDESYGSRDSNPAVALPRLERFHNGGHESPAASNMEGRR